MQHQYGFCYVEGCPVTPEATKSLLERIAVIRHTHYGKFDCTIGLESLISCLKGGFWDFTSDLASKDTAYTSAALEPHTDTTYFADPAGLQMFHLLSHTGGEGGASLLVDGFNCANKMKAKASREYRTLTEVGVPYHASGNEGISITPGDGTHPVIRESHLDGGLLQIRWNNSDRAAFTLHETLHNPTRIQNWYRAACEWVSLIRESEREYTTQLRPGRPLSMSDRFP